MIIIRLPVLHELESESSQPTPHGRFLSYPFNV